MNVDDDYQHSPAFTVAGQEPSGASLRGVDVSVHNGDVLWGSLAGAGIRFAYVRATKSTYSPDGKFLDNVNSIKGAPGSGIIIGAYHFGTPLFSPEFYQTEYDQQVTATQEASKFLSVAKDTIGAGFLPPAIDIEPQPVAFT